MDGTPTALSETRCRMHAAARMLVALAFLVQSAGVATSAQGAINDLYVADASVGAWAATTIVWLAGIALFFGRPVRPAAAILGLHLFATGIVVHLGVFGGGIAAKALLFDLTLLTALALLMLTDPGENCPARRTLRQFGRLCGTRNDDGPDMADFQATLAKIQKTDTAKTDTAEPLRRSA